LGELEVSATSCEVASGSDFVLDWMGHHSWLVIDVNLDSRRAYNREVPIKDLDALMGQYHIPS
jgi:hypothetical protein